MKEKNIMKSWSIALTAAALLPASLWAATVQGTVTSSAVPVSGAKVVLIDGLVGGNHIDSTTTSGTGTYSFTGVATGTKTVQVSLSGYNSSLTTVAVSNAGATYTSNLSITRNNNTSVVVGTVRRASDSAACRA
jgi:hypothetical protein